MPRDAEFERAYLGYNRLIVREVMRDGEYAEQFARIISPQPYDDAGAVGGAFIQAAIGDTNAGPPPWAGKIERAWAEYEIYDISVGAIASPIPADARTQRRPRRWYAVGDDV